MRTKQLLLVVLAIFIALPVSAEITRDVVYGHKDGMALVMDVYHPESNANGAGVAFMVSSGLRSSLQGQEQLEPMFAPLVDEGFTVFAIRHGSFPPYKIPDANVDVTRAIQHIGDIASSFDVDPQRIGVFGGSAGGNLALGAGLRDTDVNGDSITFRVKAVVAYYSSSYWTEALSDLPFLPDDLSNIEYYQALTHVSPNDPPVLLVHGDADQSIPIDHSEKLFAALQEAGVTSEFIPIEGMGHGFMGEDGLQFEAINTATTAMVDWFKKYLLE